MHLLHPMPSPPAIYWDDITFLSRWQGENIYNDGIFLLRLCDTSVQGILANRLASLLMIKNFYCMTCFFVILGHHRGGEGRPVHRCVKEVSYERLDGD